MNYDRKDPRIHLGGIYRITSTKTDKWYVGSAKVFKKRWGVHRTRINSGRHHCKHLQRAVAKYGKDSFHFEIMEVCSEAELLIQEQKVLDSFWPEKVLYNTSPKAGAGGWGGPCKPETKKLLSIANTGKKRSDETKKLISEAHKVENLSQQTRDNISAGQRGRVFSEETRGRMSESSRIENLSDDTRKRMSEAATGRKHDPASVARAKAKNTGQKRSEEAKARMSAAAKARATTPEGRARLSAAATLQQDRRRAELLAVEQHN